MSALLEETTAPAAATTSSTRGTARPSSSPSNALAQYLRDIRVVPLLTGEQEVELAKAIEAGVLAAERLLTDPVPSEDDAADLADLVRSGQAAKQQLIEANLRLVVALARRYTGCGTAMLDLIQEGNIGLMRAVEKFDYKRGFKFSTYAAWWIRQAIARGYGEQSRTIRVPVHVVEAIQRLRREQRTLTQDLGRSPSISELAGFSGLSIEKVLDLLKVADEPISLDLRVGEADDGALADLIPAAEEGSPIDEISQQYLRREVERLLRVLTPREQGVLQMRFGLRGSRTHTLEEVGNELGVTRERIRQIEARALARLRARNDSGEIREYLHA